MSVKLLFDCRQGDPQLITQSRVRGWRSQTLRGPVQQADGIQSEALEKEQAIKYPKDQPAFLDYEQWALPADIDKYIQVTDCWRDVRPEIRLGFYGILPGNAYWPSLPGAKAQLKELRKANALLEKTKNASGKWEARGLVDSVDFILPCLYSYYPNTGTWDHEEIWLKHYAPEMIRASRLYQKPVYPFLMQRTVTEFDVGLSNDHFRRQIEYCLENADGVCIWDWAPAETGSMWLVRSSKIMAEFV